MRGEPRGRACPIVARFIAFRSYMVVTQMREVPIMGMPWSGVAMHAGHHRGQLSVYPRLMGRLFDAKAEGGLQGP